VPIWRGGGITFGPTGLENYSHKLNVKAKRSAIRQALSMASQDGRISVIEAVVAKDGKTKEVQALLNKLGAKRQTLIVVDTKDADIIRATSNISTVKLVTAKYINVYDIVNAHHIVISQKALPIISEWLGESKTDKKEEAK
jgi:large subunit ribosomal protein L4